MVPFAAVRAKHTVSESTEVFQSSSNFISSHPFEESSLNIVLDSLSDYNSITITHSDADNTVIQNNRTIYDDFNNFNDNEKLVEASQSLSNTTQKPDSNIILDTKQETNHNTLCDPDACYNVWLAHLNLPLLTHPQTLNSFLKHIHNYNFTPLNLYKLALAILIKLDYSECLICFPHQLKPLSDYFIPSTSAYEFYPSVAIPSKFSSNNNNVLSSQTILIDEYIEPIYNSMVETVFGGHDDEAIAEQYFSTIQYDTCYNKFLAYYHIPLLPHPQTIISFLLHINSFGYLPDNACGYTLTILIKND